MVIDDLNIEGIAILEARAYAPLVIDANAPLTFTASTQSLQPVSRWNAKILQCVSVIQHLQLALGSQLLGHEPGWVYYLTLAEGRLGSMKDTELLTA